MIDFLMVNSRKKSAVTKCLTFLGEDIDSVSDHILVLAGIRIKLRKTHRDFVEQQSRYGKADK